jgi:hypothetical protein
MESLHKQVTDEVNNVRGGWFENYSCNVGLAPIPADLKGILTEDDCIVALLLQW